MIKPIKVLHIATLSNIGGLESMLIDFLDQPVNNVSFFVFSPKPILPYYQQRLTELNIPYTQVSRKRFWTNELIEYVQKNSIDLIHCHQRAKKSFRQTGVKVVIEHNHGAVYIRSNFEVLKDKSRKKYIDGIIAISNAVRIMLKARIGYEDEKIVVIPNGVSFSRLKVTNPIPRPESKKVITTVCRLLSLKGVESLIKAIPVVISERKDVEFWIIGDGPVRQKLEKLAVDLGISDYVKFWGKQTSVSNFLTSTDIFVLPSIREPFGNVLVEAGYFAKPAIATNVDGIPEILENDRTGILIDATEPFKKRSSKKDPYPAWVVDGKTKQLRKPLSLNPQNLGLAIIKLLNNQKQCEIMGKNFRESVTTSFDIERYRENIIDYYYKLLTEKS